MLEDNFSLIMDVTFTAAMEDELEQVAENTKNWKDLIRDFWNDFIPYVGIAEKEAFVPKLLTELDCPQMPPQTPEDLVAQQIFLRLLQLSRLANIQRRWKPSISKKKIMIRTLTGTNPAPYAKARCRSAAVNSAPS